MTPAAARAWLAAHRYPLLCVVLMAAMVMQMPEPARGGDFWQHSAAVRELATHPAHPRHPQVAVDAPSEFITPYTLMAAGVARGLGVDAVTALSLVGLANLALLLAGLRLLVRILSPDRADATAFYALLLTLFWWGADPWMYSGFFHLAVLGYVLPYPSTFAAGLTLVALGLDSRGEPRTRGWRAAATTLIAAVVLLAHPLTFLFLATGLGAEAVTAREGVLRRVLTTGVMLALAVGLALTWPYYSLIPLLGGASRVFDSGNKEMYAAVVSRTWPTLALFPLACIGLASRGRRAVALTLLGLIALYVFGVVAGRFSYGRVISYVVLLLHVEIADAVSGIERRARAWPPARRLAAGAALATAMVWLAWAPLSGVVLSPVSHDPPLAFLRSATGQYDVVLSDPATSRIVPSFGGKVVGADTAFAFVPDHDDRLADLARFFAFDTTGETRLEILGRRNVDHVLLWKTQDLPWEDIRRQLASWGRVTHENDSFVLLSRARDARPQQESRP